MATAVKRDARVNARLDADRAAKLEQLKRRTGESVSDLVKRGIDLVYEKEVGGEAESPLAGFYRAGFVGMFEGPGDLSERVKEEFTLALEEKYGPG